MAPSTYFTASGHFQESVRADLTENSSQSNRAFVFYSATTMHVLSDACPQYFRICTAKKSRERLCPISIVAGLRKKRVRSSLKGAPRYSSDS